jgi:hypothetical protein
MSGELAPRMDLARISAMDRRQRTAQPVRVARYEDQMDMVRHQLPGPDRAPGRMARGREEIAIERVVSLAEEHPRPAVAALCHMMRQSGNDDAGETCHGASCPDSCGGHKRVELSVTNFYRSDRTGPSQVRLRGQLPALSWPRMVTARGIPYNHDGVLLASGDSGNACSAGESIWNFH